PPFSLPLDGLQYSLWKPQCERNAITRVVSSRCRPRRIFFTALDRFYVQHFVMWSNNALPAIRWAFPGGTPHNGSLQPLQPADHVSVSVEDLSQPAVSINWRRASCQCLSLHLQVDLDVRVGRSELNVAQPSLNDGEIHARLEQVHGCRMSKTVGAYASPREAGALGCCGLDARSQYVTNAEACKRFAAGIHEEMSILLFLNTALFEMAE